MTPGKLVSWVKMRCEFKQLRCRFLPFVECSSSLPFWPTIDKFWMKWFGCHFLHIVWHILVQRWDCVYCIGCRNVHVNVKVECQWMSSDFAIPSLQNHIERDYLVPSPSDLFIDRTCLWPIDIWSIDSFMAGQDFLHEYRAFRLWLDCVYLSIDLSGSHRILAELIL